MKKILAGVLTLSLGTAACVMPFTASADEALRTTIGTPTVKQGETLESPARDAMVMEQIHFDTLLEFEQYVANLKATGETGTLTKDGRAATYLKNLDTLYYPQGLSLGKICKISVSSEWICVNFSNKAALYYYHDEIAAKTKLNESKKMAGDKALTSSGSKEVKGNMVYTYGTFTSNRCYAWVQDGMFFEMYVDFTIDANHFDRCYATGENIFAPNTRSQTQGITEKDGKVYFTLPDGTYLKGWHTSLGQTYYFRNDGSAVTGTVTINGVKYIFGSDGGLQGRVDPMPVPVEELIDG